MNAYYNPSDIKKTTVGDKLIGIICAIISFIASAKTQTVAKAVCALSVLIGFFVTISRVNGGSLSIGWGILICCLLTVVEICTISSMMGEKSED